jgi:TolA-binding protein
VEIMGEVVEGIVTLEDRIRELEYDVENLNAAMLKMNTVNVKVVDLLEKASLRIKELEEYTRRLFEMMNIILQTEIKDLDESLSVSE